MDKCMNCGETTDTYDAWEECELFDTCGDCYAALEDCHCELEEV